MSFFKWTTSFFYDVIPPLLKKFTWNLMLPLVNFPRNSHVLSRFLPMKFAFSYLGLHPITCQFLVNTLYFITYSACTWQSPLGNNELRRPCRFGLKYDIVLFVRFNFTCSKNETATLCIADKIEFQLAFHFKIK